VSEGLRPEVFALIALAMWLLLRFVLSRLTRMRRLVERGDGPSPAGDVPGRIEMLAPTAVTAEKVRQAHASTPRPTSSEPTTRATALTQAGGLRAVVVAAEILGPPRALST
jgi:hypothetical protein